MAKHTTLSERLAHNHRVVSGQRVHGGSEHSPKRWKIAKVCQLGACQTNVRIPMSSNGRGSNHVQLNPHRSRYQNLFATNAGPNTSQRQQRNCRCDRDCHDARTPHLQRCIAVRDAECILPSSSGGISRPGRMTNWRNCESKPTVRLSFSMPEHRPAQASQSHLERAASGSAVRSSVRASLAPAQPPPPAGLASGPLVVRACSLSL